VQPHNPEWRSWFATIRDRLGASLGDTCLRIEHVGSTSIPGLSAKPIIDLDIVIAQDGFERVEAKLAELGYVHQGDLGIVGREAFDLEDETLAAALPAHHLYVCAEDSAELARHIYFRERLTRNEVERTYYERKKLLIAELCEHDKGLYAQVKGIVLDTFFAKILEDAG
jgi:GrpB-like predicted nucleotidyltransferase (UPF0157 family)